MTGLYSQQAGMGMMTADYGRYPYPGYRGDLSQDCVTIAEALKPAGYATALSGKWHLTPNKKDFPKTNWPCQRGFDTSSERSKGREATTIRPAWSRDNDYIEPGENFYYTDAIAENAAQYAEEFSQGGQAVFHLHGVHRAALAAAGV